MKCPTCNSLMIVVEHEHIELDYCPDCAGVWFDSGELSLMLETMELEESSLSLDTILTSPETASREKKRRCPICLKKMKKATIGHDPEVIIDACERGDGLWFDKGEVGDLISQISTAGRTDAQGGVITFLGQVFQVKE